MDPSMTSAALSASPSLPPAAPVGLALIVVLGLLVILGLLGLILARRGPSL